VTSWALGVATTLVTFVVIGVLAWFFTPVRNRLEAKRMAVTRDHGIRLKTYGTPEEMHGLDPDQMLGAQPYWLTDSDYYFSNGIPGEGPDSKAEWSEWARASGGEGAGWRHVLVRIQATQDRTVLVLPPTVNVKRTALVGGVILGPEKEPGGNGLRVRQFNIELDAEVPVARYLSEGSAETPQFKMTKGDSEAFILIAHAIEGRHEWSVDIRLLVDGEEVSMRADDNGKPFVTVGCSGIKRLWWRFTERHWMAAAW
jgi:hypothetical protein